MQAKSVPSITIPTRHAEQIARLLDRCATHEDERAHGRVTFPLIVMKELAMEAHHWARYLEAALPPAPAAGPSPVHPAGAARNADGDRRAVG
jgi:hypothetical protein